MHKSLKSTSNYLVPTSWPAAEPLESRRLLAIQAVLDPNTGTLTVTGDAANNDVYIVPDQAQPGQIRVDELVGGQLQNVGNFAGVQKIVVNVLAGNDWVWISQDLVQPSTVNGEAGVDTLFGGGGTDRLNGGSEDDQLYGRAGDDILSGGSGMDTLEGGDNVDELYGGTENDTLKGDAGEDRLNGDSGDDHLDGGADNDNLDAGEGNDHLIGGPGADYMYGGANDDTFQCSDGVGDTADGGDGWDWVWDRDALDSFSNMESGTD